MTIKTLTEMYHKKHLEIWDNETVVWNGLPDFQNNWFEFISKKQILDYKYIGSKIIILVSY